jgi:hypothetical protein
VKAVFVGLQTDPSLRQTNHSAAAITLTANSFHASLNADRVRLSRLLMLLREVSQAVPAQERPVTLNASAD